MTSASLTITNGRPDQPSAASQGAGQLLWPLLGNFARLIVAAAGGFPALRWSASLTGIFVALAVALAAFGLINAAAVASGA